MTEYVTETNDNGRPRLGRQARMVDGFARMAAGFARMAAGLARIAAGLARMVAGLARMAIVGRPRLGRQARMVDGFARMAAGFARMAIVSFLSFSTCFDQSGCNLTQTLNCRFALIDQRAASAPFLDVVHHRTN